MNKQEIFDTVAVHLLTQKSRSVGTHPDSCQYKNKDGLKCAIGCLIKDEYYSPELEGYPVAYYKVIEALEKSGVDFNSEDFDARFCFHEFLGHLQGIHDVINVDHWKVALTDYAIRYGLNYDKVVQYE